MDAECTAGRGWEVGEACGVARNGSAGQAVFQDPRRFYPIGCRYSDVGYPWAGVAGHHRWSGNASGGVCMGAASAQPPEIARGAAPPEPDPVVELKGLIDLPRFAGTFQIR